MRSRDFFAGVAGRWDQIRRAYEHPDIQLGALAALVDHRISVIDIGTGTGALLPVLAEAAGQVVAVDNSLQMLDRARELCKRVGLQGVEFQRADIQALPFAPQSFDAAFCSMVLHHVGRPGLAMAEMARVVRPGGKVVVVAFTRHNLTWMREELAHQWLGFDRAETERLITQAGLQMGRYLVRRRTLSESSDTPNPPGRKGGQWNWPDVFLAVAEKGTEPAGNGRARFTGRV
jgi:ArsR family transcriptional regulator